MLASRSVRVKHRGVDDLPYSTTPNDAYFRSVFGDPERAALLFQARLDPALVARINWSSLSLSSGSYVDRTLAKSESDLVFTAQMDDREIVLYLLFEHQSTVDKSMALRFMGYTMQILQKHHLEHGFPLPMVVSFLLHQGPEPWTTSPQLLDLFGLSEAEKVAFGPHLPQFRYTLLDLTQLDPTAEVYHDQLKVVLQLMKLARIKKIAEFLRWLKEGLSTGRIRVPESLLEQSFVCVLHVDDVIDVETIADTLASQPQLKSNVMTLAERLIAQGEERGEARGEAIGEARGEARGKAHGEALGEVRGKIKVLEPLMGLKATTDESLSVMSLEQLNERFAELEEHYRLRFK